MKENKIFLYHNIQAIWYPKRKQNDEWKTSKCRLSNPENKTSCITRNKAINSTAQVVMRDLFSPCDKHIIPKIKQKKWSWYGFICKENRILNMRLCAICNHYVHEECVGLTKVDKGAFVCYECQL